MKTSSILAAITRMRTYSWFGALGFGLLATFSALAQQAPPAAGTSPTLDTFRPPEADMSIWILKSIFGDWEGAAQIPMLGVAMQQLNIFALAFGTMLFTFVAVVGTINSAQDGEFLGRKWSSTWVPLRFLMGTALMVPLTTGYSTAQHAILWLALMGSGGASAVWSAALKDFSGSQAAAATQSPDFKEGLEALFQEMLKAEVCMATLAQAEGLSYGMKSTAASNDGTYGSKIFYGQPTASGRNDHCGSVLTLRYDQPDEDGSYQLRSASNKYLGLSNGNIDQAGGKPVKDSTATSNAMKAYIDAQRYALIAISSGPLRTAATAITAKNDFSQGAPGPNSTITSPDTQRTIVATALKQSMQIYAQSTMGPVSTAVSSIKGDLDLFLDTSSKTGWVMAGATFFQMTAIRSKMNKVVREVPEFRNENWYTRTLSVNVASKSLADDLEALKTNVQDGFVGDSSNSMNWGDDLTKWLAKKFAFDPTSDKHALVQIKDTGDYMMVIGEAIGFAAWSANQVSKNDTASSVVSTLVSSTGPITAMVLKGLSAVTQMLLPLILVLAAALFFSGVMMSLILPTLPFLMSVGAVLGWLMAVFSAVVAAPIWLAGHLNPEGDGFSGQRAAGGYMILLETATRPIFIVLGLIGAFLIMDPMCRFAAIAFQATVNSLQGNSVTGLPSMVVLICLYVVIIWTIVRTSLTFTYNLAQQVYTWIGGQFAGYDKAQEFSNAAEHANKAAAGGLVQAQTGLGAVAILTKKSGKGVANDEKFPKKT